MTVKSETCSLAGIMDKLIDVTINLFMNMEPNLTKAVRTENSELSKYQF
jgi:hypothetical protein